MLTSQTRQKLVIPSTDFQSYTKQRLFVGRLVPFEIRVQHVAVLWHHADID